MTDKIFAQGIRFDKPREGSPDFIKGRISFKVDQAVSFLLKHKSTTGWVNLDLKKSKEKGTLYLELNDWKPREEVKDNQEEINQMQKDELEVEYPENTLDGSPF